MTQKSWRVASVLSAAFLCLCLFAVPLPSQAQSSGDEPIPPGQTYGEDEIVKTGHQFFGSVSGGIASVVERAFSQYGEPNGYILGEEGSGAIIAGARYGEGHLYTRNAGNHKIFWQGPSVGWDFGADGARVMMLIYNLPTVNSVYQRFAGVNGSAYLVGGAGMTVLLKNEIVLVPVRAGVGARLGLNLGYLKFTDKPTWNPF
ncbi:DUF1134 domain-containing protein [Roseibium porphyridii]|uniref:DUF1134 domain-containing protein n=1 Tax=Roseibium porphyridii TaxID=2866279 RepID=A0ABY8F5K2_9HYPH|nr:MULTISPECIES: DUF1134 domain-containing protein [Stappiaceae]QFT30124.1 hypothetical protein FIV00_06560 [Labrenzia sp. THAF82]WFE90778.1 DUF1134 domain-containing protein [Roseibium sp. KMA01]